MARRQSRWLRSSFRTETPAKSALSFRYRIVLGVELLWLDEVIGAKSQWQLPVALTPGQVRSLLHKLDGTMGLVVSLLSLLC